MPDIFPLTKDDHNQNIDPRNKKLYLANREIEALQKLVIKLSEIAEGYQCDCSYADGAGRSPGQIIKQAITELRSFHGVYIPGKEIPE